MVNFRCGLSCGLIWRGIVFLADNNRLSAEQAQQDGHSRPQFIPGLDTRWVGPFHGVGLDS